MIKSSKEKHGGIAVPRKLKINLILSTVTMLLPAIAGLILWNRLPAGVPMHWNAFGEADGYGSKLFLVAGLPALLLLFHIITAVSLIVLSKKPGENNIGGLALTMWLMPVISISASAFVYSAALGVPVNSSIFVPAVTCVVFLITGFILWRYPGLKAINFPTNCLATRSFSGIVMMVCSVIGMLLSIFKLYYLIIPVGVMCIVVPIIYHFARGRYIG